jgi:HAD superfamily hydrolase (TIGR01509 family)
LPDPGLIIFDCDGVLVDSEPIAIRVLVEGLTALGHAIDEATAYERFLGRSLAAMQAILRDESGLVLSPDDLERMRLRLFDCYRRELRPISGIVEVLDDLAVPYCVASSSQPERLRFSLEVTGLLPRFEPHLFSAAMVAQGKPAPDLFLYVAERMAARPADCLVIEDSPAGIEAAHRAGMRAFAFTGGGHARQAAYRDKLEALMPEAMFEDMRQLPELLQSRSR